MPFILIPVFFIVSCGHEEPELITKINWSDYAIVLPVSGVRQDSVSAYNALLAKIRQETGKNPEIRHETDDPVKNEILIDCDRDEFREPENLVRADTVPIIVVIPFLCDCNTVLACISIFEENLCEILFGQCSISSHTGAGQFFLSLLDLL